MSGHGGNRPPASLAGCGVRLLYCNAAPQPPLPTHEDLCPANPGGHNLPSILTVPEFWCLRGLRLRGFHLRTIYKQLLSCLIIYLFLIFFVTWANKEFEFCLHRHTLVVCRGHGFASFCCLHPRTAHEGHLWQMGLARDARRHIASKSPKKPHHTVLGKQSSLPPPSVVSDSKQHHRWSKFFSSNNKKILKPTTFPDYPPPGKRPSSSPPGPSFLGAARPRGLVPPGGQKFGIGLVDWESPRHQPADEKPRLRYVAEAQGGGQA